MTHGWKQYHGPVFWLSLLSFVVPLAVAARAFHEVQLTTKPTPHPDASGVDHAIWDYLLRHYVAGGLIDYDAISRDHLFATYLAQLAAAEPEKLTTAADELALMINAYNAFVVQGVVSHRIDDSVMNFEQDGVGLFDVPEHVLANTTVSLNQLEHEMIRQQFAEPRVHVALVCAARSCPAIRGEAYTGRRLDAQLEDQSVRFANSEVYVRVDQSDGRLWLSPILDWYGSDWETQGGYLQWLSQRVEDEQTRAVLQQALRGDVRVEFMDYDWSLNSQDSTGPGGNQTPASAPASFGSGSVPNR